MTLIRMLGMIFFITALPMSIGCAFLTAREQETKAEKIFFGWTVGLFILWTLFLLICVPMTLLKKNFTQVFTLYVILSLTLFGMAFLGKAYCFFRQKQFRNAEKDTALHKGGPEGKKEQSEGKGRAFFFLWLLSGILFLLQIAGIFLLAYEEGDDAYYVAVTTMSSGADRLYTKIPYTGAFTELPGRYALAPFPVWVAVLSRIAGLNGAATAHLVMPVLIVTLAYGLYYLIGKRLLRAITDEKPWAMPLYLCFAELLVLFGGYSTYSKENFLLVRAGQGKAVLANLIIPMLLYFLLLLTERLEEKKRGGLRLWFLMALTIAAGCLCSTLGSFLLCALLSLGILCAATVYRDWRLLPCLIPCMVIPVVILLLYMKL